jgi:HAD superfamily hydrolase (TIGR01509 family)
VKGLPWRWNGRATGELLRITGGRERLLHDMATRTDAPVLAGQREALARELHRLKNTIYADIVRGGALPLRAGVAELMADCREAGVRQAIVTTTSRSNLDALLTQALGPRWADGFATLVCGEDVQRKKPDPEAYVQAVKALGLSPLQAVAIEDSPGGVAAARAADVPVLVVLSHYFADAIIDGAIAIGPGLTSGAAGARRSGPAPRLAASRWATSPPGAPRWTRCPIRCGTRPEHISTTFPGDFRWLSFPCARCSTMRPSTTTACPPSTSTTWSRSRPSWKRPSRPRRR